jgi:ABC-type branched-subunit amino acid transport system ATPase component
MLISINIVSTRPTEHTKDINKSEDKALAHTKKIVQGIHITEKNTRKAKKIKYSNKRNVMFVTN